MFTLMFTLPGRASDAGPLPQPAPPQTWDDHAEEAEEELRSARRLYRDDPILERKLRIECLDRAQEAITQARALLERVQLADQGTAGRWARAAAAEVRG